MTLDYITPFRTNSFVFNQLLNKYKSCLDDKMDEIFYGGIGLIIAISQQNYDFVQLTGKQTMCYTIVPNDMVTIYFGFQKNPIVRTTFTKTQTFPKLWDRLKCCVKLKSEPMKS